MLRKNKLIVLVVISALALRLIFMSPWLEDWDSVQFALGMHEFNLAKNQPHAPGYPIYILLGKLIYFFTHNDTLSLTLLSAFSGGACIIFIYLLTPRIFSFAKDRKKLGLVAAIFAAVIPIGWVMAESALTNIVGLAFLLAFSLFLIRAKDKKIARAVFLGGLILGVRFTEFPVIISLIALTHLKRFSLKGAFSSVSAFLCGIATWAIPSAIITGIPGFVSSYEWIAGYVIRHDSLVNKTPSVYLAFWDRMKQLTYLLTVSYHPLFLLAALAGLLLVYRQRESWKRYSTQFLGIFLLSYLLPLLFIYNLEVPRYTLPLLPPLAIFASCFIFKIWSKNAAAGLTAFAIIVTVLFAQGLSQVKRFKNMTPPTIAATKYIQENFSPKDALILSSFTYRQLQYYAPQYQSYYDKLPTTEEFGKAKYIILDYLGLKDKIPKTYKISSIKSITFSGDKDIFTRVPQITIYTVQLASD